MTQGPTVEARVRFFGPVRSLVGKKEQMVRLDGSPTLRRLLEELGRSSGPEFQRYVVIQGNTLNPALLISLNSQTVEGAQDLDAPLPQGATLDVMLVVPIMGG